MAFEKSTGGNTASGSSVGPDGQFKDEQGLTSGMFPNHGPEGVWQSEKGSMLQPHEFMGIESTSEHGASRAYSPSKAVSPSTTIDVNTPLTMGGGTFAS
jgi:hypothetical protein